MTDEELAEIRNILLKDLPLSNDDKTPINCPYDWEDNRIEVRFYNIVAESLCPQYHIKFTVIRPDLKVIIEQDRMMGDIGDRGLIGKKIVRNIFHAGRTILNKIPDIMTSYPTPKNNSRYYELSFRPKGTLTENWHNTLYEEGVDNNFLLLNDKNIYNRFIQSIANLEGWNDGKRKADYDRA